MMKCNGCGAEIGKPEQPPLHGTLSYGEIYKYLPEGATEQVVTAEHHKKLCPRCQHVMKDILLSSDLSEQWDSYDWTLIGGAYVENYD